MSRGGKRMMFRTMMFRLMMLRRKMMRLRMLMRRRRVDPKTARVCASLRCQNTHQHVTRAISYGNLQEKTPGPA